MKASSILAVVLMAVAGGVNAAEFSDLQGVSAAGVKALSGASVPAATKGYASEGDRAMGAQMPVFDLEKILYFTNVKESYVAELVGYILSDDGVVICAADTLLKMPKKPISPSEYYAIALGFTVMGSDKAEKLPGSKWEVLETYEVPAPELPMALSKILEKEFPAVSPGETGWFTCLSKRLLSFKRSPNGITIQLKTSPY